MLYAAHLGLVWPGVAWCGMAQHGFSQLRPPATAPTQRLGQPLLLQTAGSPTTPSAPAPAPALWDAGPVLVLILVLVLVLLKGVVVAVALAVVVDDLWWARCGGETDGVRSRETRNVDDENENRGGYSLCTLYWDWDWD